jgi:trehalose 6-phosphate phosphatase
MTRADTLPRFAPDWALFLDVDGTLAEIVARPDAVHIDPATIRALGEIRDRLDGALALISGRRVATLDRLFAPLRLPAAGLHGLERRRPDGTIIRHAAPADALAEIKSELERFAAGAEGLLVEDKGLTMALHYRLAPACGEAARALARELAGRFGGAFVVQTGHMVVELRPAGPDKGGAIEAFMAEPPFHGRRPVFVGDDVTDEAGFAVVNALDGHSIRVGEGATAAEHRVASVVGLRAWLAALADRTLDASVESNAP